MRTLIADDDNICRTILTRVLSDFGTTIAASDGIGAIAEVARSLAENHPFDLICLDIQMPGIDGRQCLEIIRRLEQDCGLANKPAHIAIISSLKDNSTILGAFRNQADLYFTKPIDFQHVIAQLAQAKLIPE